MKVIIAGSRTITDFNLLKKVITASGFNITEVVCGGARGVDSLGQKWAELNNIPVKLFPANWNAYRKSAGYIRNKQMSDYADALVCIWDGSSKGSKHMLELADKNGLEIYLHMQEG